MEHRTPSAQLLWWVHKKPSPSIPYNESGTSFEPWKWDNPPMQRRNMLSYWQFDMNDLHEKFCFEAHTALSSHDERYCLFGLSRRHTALSPSRSGTTEALDRHEYVGVASWSIRSGAAVIMFSRQSGAVRSIGIGYNNLSLISGKCDARGDSLSGSGQ